MFCTKCGAKNEDMATFCTSCGAPLRKADSTQNTGNQQGQSATQQPYTQPVQPTAQQPYTQQVQPGGQQPYTQQVQLGTQQAYGQQPYTQQVQPGTQQPYTQHVQPGTQQPYAQQVPPYAAQTTSLPPKKRNLGKILGLSIGIPVGVIASIVFLVIAVNKLNPTPTHNPVNGYSAGIGGGSSSHNGNQNSGNSQNNSGGTDSGNSGYNSGSNGNTSSANTDNYEPADPEENVYSEENATRTLMIYMVGSDLETENGYASGDIAEICDAHLPDNVNIVLECGGAKEWFDYNIPDGEVTRFKVENGELVKLEELGHVSMTTQGQLADFIKFSKARFPANNYTLILWNHGGGIPVGFGCDELGDYYDTMCDYEIRAELKEANVKFDAVLFDACNMCTLEMARALDGYADYMVGAESYVNGTGMYYTSWLSSLDGDPRAFSEKIVQDYMNQNKINGLIGSMSVIRLDYIDGVYEAYVNYLAEANEALSYGDYSTYYQARGNCGYYESNDSVDLITLATSYNNEYSTPLMNAVVNAVVYTESDFVYGHGLMAYSPYESYYNYDEGRQSFVELGYDQDVMDFYDNFISRELAYFEEDNSTYYDSEWYYDDYADEAAAVSEAMSGYELGLYDMGNYYVVDAPDDLWEDIYTISEVVMVDDGEKFWVLGQEYSWETDSYGNVALVNPEYWTTVNGKTATYYCIDYYTDGTGNWAQTGVVPILVNGNEALLYLYYDNNNPDGVVQGYSYYNFATDEESDEIYSVSMEDTLTLMVQFMDYDGNLYYEENGDPFNAEEIRINYEDATYLDDFFTAYGYYEATDVYGNIYQTEFVELGDYADLE